eukprot:GHVQ01039685.1.p1 GENE.GHVQ01039685.1~~GHVQ01039685.1.p1  ORF type:complete len:481 (-),score=106.51 GHVQ01039685.1:19-1461(-)
MGRNKIGENNKRIDESQTDISQHKIFINTTIRRYWDCCVEPWSVCRHWLSLMAASEDICDLLQTAAETQQTIEDICKEETLTATTTDDESYMKYLKTSRVSLIDFLTEIGTRIVEGPASRMVDGINEVNHLGLDDNASILQMCESVMSRANCYLTKVGVEDVCISREHQQTNGCQYMLDQALGVCGTQAFQQMCVVSYGLSPAQRVELRRRFFAYYKLNILCKLRSEGGKADMSNDESLMNIIEEAYISYSDLVKESSVNITQISSLNVVDCSTDEKDDLLSKLRLLLRRPVIRFVFKSMTNEEMHQLVNIVQDNINKLNECEDNFLIPKLEGPTFWIINKLSSSRQPSSERDSGHGGAAVVDQVGRDTDTANTEGEGKDTGISNTEGERTDTTNTEGERTDTTNTEGERTDTTNTEGERTDTGISKTEGERRGERREAQRAPREESVNLNGIEMGGDHIDVIYITAAQLTAKKAEKLKQ